jgi:hypothetical protein
MHVYMYVLDGIATPNGEIGISDSRSSPCPMSPIIGTTWRAQRQQPVNFGIVVNNFNFDFNFDNQRSKFLLFTALPISCPMMAWYRAFAACQIKVRARVL